MDRELLWDEDTGDAECRLLLRPGACVELGCGEGDREVGTLKVYTGRFAPSTGPPSTWEVVDFSGMATGLEATNGECLADPN